MAMPLAEWYADREILLTGVTSELGTNLLEKLLRSFPDIKIYTLIRSRYGLNGEDRIKTIFTSPGYERLRQQDPNAIKRIIPIDGNLLYANLGLGKEDFKSVRNVSVIFHAAGPHDAVFEFGQDLPNIKAIGAASSIFRHKGQINEQLQNETIPNLPLALVRIPILGPAHREPLPGYVGVLRGPTALMVGAGYAFGNSAFRAEITPVDEVTNTLITAVWDIGSRTTSPGILVYNVTTIGCTWDELIKKGKRAGRNFAYPTFGIRGMTSSVLIYWFCIMFLEWLPSVLCDAFIILCGGKPRLYAEYGRIRNALRTLEPVASRNWSAERKRVHRLKHRLESTDRETFPIGMEMDIESYVLCAAAATKKYCVDESKFKIVKIFNYSFFASVFTVLIYSSLFWFNN